MGPYGPFFFGREEDTLDAENRLFLHLRTAAESGWDFSARWFRGGDDLDDIHAADILPVDLNCLLYLLEETIADAHRTILQPILT